MLVEVFDGELLDMVKKREGETGERLRSIWLI